MFGMFGMFTELDAGRVPFRSMDCGAQTGRRSSLHFRKLARTFSSVGACSAFCADRYILQLSEGP